MEERARRLLEAKACAVAVARALGWLPAEEAKLERRLVEERWEVRTDCRWPLTGRDLLVNAGSFSSVLDARALKERRGCSRDRIVHVRRYAVGKGKVKP